MTEKKFRICGTGCALVDYLYKPIDFSDHIFSGYLSNNPGDGGLAPGKLVFTKEFEKYVGKPYPEVRNQITNRKRPIALNIGGPSIVSLIHASQILQGSPVEVKFFGSMGSDEGGEFIKDKLKATPLMVGYYKTGSQYTPFTDVLSDPDYNGGQGERIFINNIGAAWELFPSDLDDSFFSSDMVVFGGTALVPNIHKSLDDILLKAKSNKSITVVNTVYDFLSEEVDPYKPWPLGESVNSYQNIDILITDMEEGLKLSGTKTVESAINFFISTGVGSFIITHGANPIHFYANNLLFGNVPVRKLPVSDRIKAELKLEKFKSGDTTGCGDNFAGGVIASVAGQKVNNPNAQVNLIKAIALGIASGGFACFYNGGTFYEEYEGQKSKLVNSYYLDYMEQINMKV